MPTDPNTDFGLEPPDDFGAAILAEFKKREFGSGGAAMSSDAPPPGGWPGGATVSADHLVSLPDANGTDPVGTALPAGELGVEGQGEEDPAPGSGGGGVEPSPAATAEVEGGDPASSTSADDSTDDSTELVDAQAEPTPGPDAPAPAAEPAPGYVWRDGDVEVPFTDEQVQQALAVSAWATQLPEETRNSFAAIEAGQAVAIARKDFDEFQAWKDQQSRRQRDADLDNLDVDPDVAQVISSLRDEVAQLRGGASAASVPGAQPTVPFTPQVDANLTATANLMDQAALSYAEERQLSENEFQRLYAAAVNANVIPALADSLAIKNPVTGLIVAPADPGEVIRQALDFALVRDPALHAAVTQRTSTPSPSNTPTPADAALTAKKARAGSVASAPSAAVTPTPRDAATRSPQETVNAIAEELAAAMGRV